MEKQPPNPEAIAQYASAHAIHYTDKDLLKASTLYRSLIAQHPDAQLAASRSGAHNSEESFPPFGQLL